MKSMISQIYQDNPAGNVSENPDTGIICVSHYPAASEIWHYTGNTVEDSEGNQIQEVERIS